jgi:hypothetical protein
MATAYKILGQEKPSDTSNTTLYTVPASTEAIVSTITVTNVTGTDSSFRLFVVASGDSATIGNALAYDATLSANTFISFTLGLTLSAGDLLVVRSGIGDSLTYQAFGSELS